jgi:hypothetical protein
MCVSLSWHKNTIPGTSDHQSRLSKKIENFFEIWNQRIATTEQSSLREKRTNKF